ncbi:hypothetical protein DFQ30_008181, partial [Apophysomyces sp. BC1015]
NNTIRQWSPQLSTSRVVISVAFDVISMACAYGVVLVGGLAGKYVYKRLDDDKHHFGMTMQNSNCTTNHLDITDGPNGDLIALISSNDRKTRFLNLDTTTITNTLTFPFPVNVRFIKLRKK